MKRIIEVSTVIGVLVLVLARWAALEKVSAPNYQDLSGEVQVQLILVQPDVNVLIAERNLIPYRFQITPDTRIAIGNRKATMEDLAELRGETVTVKFRETPDGNIANQISIS